MKQRFRANGLSRRSRGSFSRYKQPSSRLALRLAGTTTGYGSGLIAQETLTVTPIVSSPCATGAEAAIGAASLRNCIGAGKPSSEILIGAPSVTPAALA